MSLWDRLTYRWACWWLDSPRVDRVRRRVASRDKLPNTEDGA